MYRIVWMSLRGRGGRWGREGKRGRTHCGVGDWGGGGGGEEEGGVEGVGLEGGEEVEGGEGVFLAGRISGWFLWIGGYVYTYRGI